MAIANRAARVRRFSSHQPPMNDMGQAVSASAAPEVEGVKRAVPERVAAAGAPALSVFSLHGTTTIITGGGHGLGQTLSKGIAEAGGSVACLDLHATPGNDHGEWSEIVSIAASTGATATYQRCDIMDETAMNEAFQAIAQKARDAVRGVVACTRIQQMRPAASYPLQDFRRILETNVTGALVTAKAAAGLWRAQAIRGSLVLIASTSGLVATRGSHCTAYAASQAAVHQMCRSLAQEWGPAFGIRVNTISPGWIRTAATDQILAANPGAGQAWFRGALLGRLGTSEDLVGPTLFLLSDASGFVTGADLRVDGGHCASS